MACFFGIWIEIQNQFKCIIIIISQNSVTSDITCMCFILERKGIAVGTSNGTIQLFDGLNQYCEMDSIPAHKSEITNVKWIEVWFVVLALYIE